VSLALVGEQSSDSASSSRVGAIGIGIFIASIGDLFGVARGRSGVCGVARLSGGVEPAEARSALERGAGESLRRAIRCRFRWH
jgi:hypothetical protein